MAVAYEHCHDQRSETLQDVDLLRYYAAEWDRYTTGANYLNRLFTYLNRYWVKRERDEGKKGVYQVYTVCLALKWSDFLASKLFPDLPARPRSMENILFFTYTTRQLQVDQCRPSTDISTT